MVKSTLDCLFEIASIEARKDLLKRIFEFF